MLKICILILCFTDSVLGACVSRPLPVSYCVVDQNSDHFHGKYCYLKKTYTAIGPVIERGLANETDCRQNQAYSSINNHECWATNPRAGTICYDCCQEFLCLHESHKCNQRNEIDQRFMPDFMKSGTSGQSTKPVATTQPTQRPTITQQASSTTHAPPSTTSVPMTTKTVIPAVTTPLSTTTSSTVTQASGGSTCLVCTEYTNSTCSITDQKQCCGEKPHCLNEVIYSNGRRSRTVHRCASNVQCYWDYWVGTRGSNCSQTGVCTYCCDSTGPDPCNKVPEKPPNLLKFDQQTQNQAHKCMVTDDQNGEKLTDCSESDGRFCMNTVYYNIQTNDIVRSEKKCTDQIECKGKWLRSRQQNACLTGNTTGVVSGINEQVLLCHYCCESNSTTPCNLRDKPDQIEQFIQQTTSAPLTTTTLPVTTPPPTNSSVPLRKCNICGDPQLGIPCTLKEVNTPNLQDCPTQFPYCMTDLIQDDKGNKDVYKRCATDHMCRKEWITQTANDQNNCDKFGKAVAYQCHFCCTSDGCNSGLIPNSTYWYTVHK